MSLKEKIQACRQEIEEIPADQVKSGMESGAIDFVVDVRESDEFKRGHVEGALHISRGWLEIEADPTTPKAHAQLAGKYGATIVCYCGQAPGARQLLAARTLKEMGYQHVTVMQGGIKTWTEAGFSVVSE